jgi:hypothetical protein
VYRDATAIAAYAAAAPSSLSPLRRRYGVFAVQYNHTTCAFVCPVQTPEGLDYCFCNRQVGWGEEDYMLACMDQSDMMADLNDPAGNCSLSATGGSGVGFGSAEKGGGAGAGTVLE